MQKTVLVVKIITIRQQQCAAAQKHRGDREKKLAPRTSLWKVLPACLQHPAPAVLLWSETCPICLARIQYVWGVVSCVLLLWSMTESLGGTGTACVDEPYVAHSCHGGWAPALVLQADGGPCVASHLWGHFCPRGGWWRIRNWHAFYFLNSTFSDALCWGL